MTNWLDSNRIEEERQWKELILSNPLETFKENLFKQFQVDLKNEIKTQFYYLKYTNLQPSEIRLFDYWEWQLMIDEMKEYMEKEKEEQEKQNGQQSYKNTSEYKDAQSQMRSYGIDPSSPGRSTGGGFRMPSNLGNLGSLSPGSMNFPKI